MTRPVSGSDTPEHRLLLDVLDSLGAGLAFFGCDGALLHGTRAMTLLLARQPDGAALQDEVQRFADLLCGIVEGSDWRGVAGVRSLCERAVPADDGVYRLRGSYLGGTMFGLPAAILVALEPPAARGPDAEALRARWQLSERQAAVARLLAEGRTNDDIARDLGISQHTARRHTEQAMRKLGARSRAEAAAILLRG